MYYVYIYIYVLCIYNYIIIYIYVYARVYMREYVSASCRNLRETSLRELH